MKQEERDRYRPIPFYFINTTEPDALTAAAVHEAMEKLRAAGFGGCVVFNKPPDGFRQEDYLEGKWFELLGHFAEAGRRLDLQIWLNDGFDFPPGDAGGRIQKLAPRLKQRMFVRGESGEITVQEVDWGFPAFEEPESSSLFIELVYERHKQHLGRYFGNGITGFFSDADCRRFGPVAGKALRERDKYFPCSRNFQALFKDKYGYALDMAPFMSGGGGQAAEDYWALCGELYARWFKNNHEWCRRNGLKYTFHSSDTGPFALAQCRRSSIFTEGSYFHLARQCDYPGTDHELLALNGGKHFSGKYFIPKATWGGDGRGALDESFHDTFGDTRAKYAASAAFLQGKGRALCEAFAATNWGVDFVSLRQIAAWQIMQGINLFVPHAVHHRLHGETKFFAPPDFSEFGSLHPGVREFNDWLAETCAIASQGTLVAPVALLDPTRAVWRGESDAHAFFASCDRLNHAPYGYAIADEEAILERPGRFKVLVNPGLGLSQKLIDSFTAGGGVILRHDQLDELPEILGADIAFEGDGRLQYLRRRLASGEETLLAANVGNKGVVKGQLAFKGNTRAISLRPGEIIPLTDKGGTPQPDSPVDIIPLPEEYAVTWGRENLLPLSRWEDGGGRATPLASPAERLFFRWENSEPIPPPQLLLPGTFQARGAMVMVDGEPIGGGEATTLFADHYLRFALDKAAAVGGHVLELRRERPGAADFNALYLAGEFSVKVESAEDFACLHREYYSMELYLPSMAKVILGPRPRRLAPFSWAEQGHPFYSGAATYHVELEIPAGFSGVSLVLPEVNAICAVKCDGVELGKRIWPPHEFELPPNAGVARLEMTVWNTLANMLEGYRAASGIVARPFVRCKKQGN